MWNTTFLRLLGHIETKQVFLSVWVRNIFLNGQCGSRSIIIYDPSAKSLLQKQNFTFASQNFKNQMAKFLGAAQFSEISLCCKILVILLIQFSLGSLQTQKGNVSCHYTTFEYSWANWEGLQDHFRDAPWEDIFYILIFLFA